MEIADLMSILLLALIVVLFWAMIPGLIAGWILREAGRSFVWGCVLGVLCGPVGVLVALLFVSLSRRRTGRALTHSSSSAHPQISRSYYEVPLIGRLHVSTVGALAGVATFACVWVLGGLSFELYRHGVSKQSQSAAVVNTHTPTQPQTSSNVKNSNPVSPQATPAESVAVTGETLASERPATLEDLARRSTRPAQTSINAGLPPVQSEQATSSQSVQASNNAAAKMASTVKQATEDRQAANPQNVKPALQAREAIISEITQSLSAKGYRVHAALSGDAQTATLSLSCAALTRESGNSLLGNNRTREAMRAAGIRIVVMINGQESWTYML